MRVLVDRVSKTYADRRWKASRHYFDAVLAKKGGAPYDEVVAITAKYTGAPPELIRKGFRWWYRQKLVKTPLAEKDVVDETFRRDALAAKR